MLASRFMSVKTIIYALLFMSVSACASSPPSPSDAPDLARTWYEAQAALPPSLSRDTGIIRVGTPALGEALDKAEGRTFPVVIYMHGCTGLEGVDRDVIRALAGAGYVVIAPDSMARAYRPRQCNPRTRRGGFNLFVFDFRQAEINFALQQLFEQPWVDWDNLFLVGVSEGGLAAAHHRGSLFRARVITQWTCHGDPLVSGIDGPDDTPVLSIVRGDDPWYDGEETAQRGDCGVYFGADRPGSQSIVLQDGSGHGVMDEPEVVQRIIQFLNRHRAR